MVNGQLSTALALLEQGYTGETAMSEREKLERAITDVEAQRAALGDESADMVLAGLRKQLAELDGSAA